MGGPLAARDVGALRKDGSVLATADINLNSHKLTNLTNGSNPQDAAAFNQAGGGGGGGGTANALATSGAAVSVIAAAPPSIGQILKATDPTHATWQSISVSFDINAIPKRVWVDAAIGAYTGNSFTGTPSNGSNIQSWAGQDGLGGANGLVRFVFSGTAPTYVTSAVNSLPAIDFTGGNQQLLSADYWQPNREGNMIFAVVSRPWTTHTNAYRGLLGYNTNSAAVWLDTPTGGSAGARGVYVSANGLPGGVPQAYGSRPVYTDGTFHVITAAWGLAPTFRFDGTIVSSFIAGSTEATFATGQALYLGNDSGGDFFDGQLAELIIVPGVLSFDQMHKVEQYLGSKYAITIA